MKCGAWSSAERGARSSAEHRGARNTHTTKFLENPVSGSFLRSCPWTVSSNSQLTALAHPLVTRSWPRLTCAPHEGGYEKGVGSASPGFAHILPMTASLIPMSCHMREINPTNHSLSSHSPSNQIPCCPSNFFPRTLFKKVHFTLLTFPRTIDWAMVPLLLSSAIQHAHNTPTLGKKKRNKINFKKN